MCFELVELYLENSLFLLKACLCNDRVNAQNQQGSRWFSHRLCGETYLRSLKYLHFMLFACACIYIFMRVCVKVCKCPDGGGHSERALLQPRVYLQTVTLMQCNDYFYSRYFGSRSLWVEWLPIGPLITSVAAATPGSFSSPPLSAITPSALPSFYYYTFICFSLSSLSVYLYPLSKFNYKLQHHFLWSLSPPQHLHHIHICVSEFICFFFRLLLHFYSSTSTCLLCQLHDLPATASMSLGRFLQQYTQMLKRILADNV